MSSTEADHRRVQEIRRKLVNGLTGAPVVFGYPVMHESSSELGDCRIDDCPLSELIAGYVKCTLEDAQVTRLDAHLLECKQCSELLVRIIDSGTEPTWLPTARKLQPAGEEHQRQTVDGSRRSLQFTDPRIATLNSSPRHFVAPQDSEPLGHRYQVVRLHGRGGMGHVWEGWDTVLKRRVALKQLPADQQHEKQRVRLLQEASSLARLSHPNIVSVFEIVALEQNFTIVMEFIDGPTLAKFGKETVMGERQAARILEKLASAVSHAHENGVIHRDLKPGNVLLCCNDHGEGTNQDLDQAIPKLTDFGLARIVEGEGVTRTGDILGTPAYMAPEQTLGQANLVGPGADIYGLGAILYELLVGTPPHVSDDPLVTLLSVREREPLAPRAIRTKLSKDLQTICLKCLRKLPKDRYARAADLQRDLQAFLDGRPIAARPLNPLVAAMRWSRRHKPIMLAVLTSLALFLTILVVSLWTARTERKMRLVADQSQQQSKIAEERIAAEAARANRELAVNQERFDVAFNQLTQLSLLLAAPRLYGYDVRKEDYDQRIDEAVERIYATYLSSLPPPDQWTLRDGKVVVGYVELMNTLGKQSNYLPWQTRLEEQIHRIESAGPMDAELLDFVVRHNFSMCKHFSSTGDFRMSAHYCEKAARLRLAYQAAHPEDLSNLRLCSHLLMTTGLSYGQAGDHENAIRVVSQSLSLYREILADAEATLEDRANFLDKLMWHRHVYTALGRTAEALEHEAEFRSLANEFGPSSEFYGRVQATVNTYDAMPRGHVARESQSQ